jgi:NTP pyrophosphatase (non-canonical NTP hydrolase)
MVNKVNESIVNAVLKVSKKERKPILARTTKLLEECGELSVAVLKKEGWKGMGKDTVASNHDNILEEGCDVVIIALSILSKYKFTEDQINAKMKVKLAKWLNIINSK